MVMYEDDPRVKEDFLTEEENSIVEGKNTPTKLNLYEAQRKRILAKRKA